MSPRGYGILDVTFAALYAYLGFVVAASRSFAFQAALGVVVALLFAAGVALISNAKISRMLGVVACVVLLVFTASCLVLLALSSAYLYGVYGAVGRALGAMTLVAAALAIELFGLLPVFQLRAHLRSAQRR